MAVWARWDGAAWSTNYPSIIGMANNGSTNR